MDKIKKKVKAFSYSLDCLTLRTKGFNNILCLLRKLQSNHNDNVYKLKR